MVEIKIKKRISMFFGILFLLTPLIFGGVYMSVDSLLIYFSFPDDFVFSSFIIYGITSALVLVPVVVLSLYPIFFGRMAPLSFQKKLSRFIIISFFVSVASQFFFKMYFENELRSRGYIACQGTPLGWTPMMATKYVTDKKLCLRSRR